ncbi:MAG: pitrilysin family protein [Pyrinomonadaceae bacterium]
MVRVTSVEGITEYRLANGLRVLLFPDQTKQTITVNMTYLVGSRHESYGETGMAHLLEHLVFKGTPRHTNIPQELTQHGAQPNGSTSFDRTNYFETFNATDENLNWSLDLEADRMVNSFIAKTALDSEMTVVRNEMESGENSPFRILLQRILASAFEWHNYGKDTIGARSDIENVPIDRLQAFYRKYYQPDNAVLTVSGKIDEGKTLSLVQKYYGAVPKPERVLPAIYTSEPTQDGERLVTLRRTGDEQVLGAGYHIPPGSHPDFAAIDVLTEILSDTPSGRLHKALVETKKASSVLGFNFQQKEPGLLYLGAEVRTQDPIEPAREAFLSTIEGAGAQAPTAEEVDRARTSLLKQIDLILNSSNRVGLTMSEWIAMGDWRLFFLHRDRLRKVTPADVQRVAQKYLKSSNRTLGIFEPTAKPDRAEIPAVSDTEIAGMVKDYKGDAKIAEGEAFDPSPANIEARTKRTAAKTGVALALLPKKTRGETVFASLTLRMGNEKALMNRSTAGSLTGSMLMRGTAKHTRQQLQDEFDKLKARVSVGGGSSAASATIETTRGNLPAVMRLVAEILREPAFPATEFEQLKTEQLAAIEQQKSDPTTVAVNNYFRHLNPYPKGDVRYVPEVDENIENIKATTLDDVKKFYADFYGASNGQLAVVGDFDDQAVAQLVGQLFANWKNKTPFTRVATVFNDVPVLNKSFETPDKANAFFLAGMNLKLRDDDPDYPALALGAYMLGGGFLNSRLAVRIRQKEGISYGVGAGLNVNSWDQASTFTANAIYAPQNVARLEAAFNEEIARALKDGFTPEEIAAAKSGYLQSRSVQRSQDIGLAGRLGNYLYLNRTLAFDADFEQKVAALTPEQISSAMRKHIDPAKITIIKAGDFAKAGAKPAQ